jgi:biofilm PGA synthesis N-glycosyltransferase PgaC
MDRLFWASIVTVAYVYVGYPVLLAVWSAIASRPVRKQRTLPWASWPSVSVIVAARNEARRLPSRVRNLLEQDYPGPVEIIVVSDGSTDATRSAVAPYRQSVRLIELPQGGKPTALNAGVQAATGDILVFADARQRFATDAIRQLVGNFSDRLVGGVTGELVLETQGGDPSAADSTISEGVSLYWRYEKWLRRHESRVASTLGATGAIYALRRDLWRPLPPETLLDDVLAPMRAVLAGYRMVFDDEAKAFDRPEADSAIESRRKTRTLAGNYQILALEPRLLLPFGNPVWGQYVSHKLGRLVVPWALIVTLVTSALLATHGWIFAVALMLQLGLYGLAAYGMWTESRELSRTSLSTPDVTAPARAEASPAVIQRRHVPRSS